LFKIMHTAEDKDINHGGHLDFVKITSLFSQLRSDFFRAKDIADIDEYGLGFISTNISIDLISEVKLGELMMIELTKVTRKLLKISFHISATNIENSKIAARGIITMVPFNYKTRRPVRLAPFHPLKKIIQ